MAVKTAQKGYTVSVEYTGTLETGETFDSSKGKEPLQFKIGANQVIKGFENGVAGMKVGDEKNVKIKPSEGYGERNENYIKEMPKASVPKDLELKTGMMLIFKREDGMRIPGVVTGIKTDTIKVDFNHPLSGKTLNFKIKLVDIK
ncbi:TPA: peptidylprolyl isomerase [Candidatus Woesearchaeota archaeon]|nr:peptidylprolyl isomerase [Candidatus Woesearchaeota archaeon]